MYLLLTDTMTAVTYTNILLMMYLGLECSHFIIIMSPAITEKKEQKVLKFKFINDKSTAYFETIYVYSFCFFIFLNLL